MPQTTIYVSPRSFGAPDERPPAVVTTDLARLYAGSAALAGVSLRIRAATCVALTGANGAGKTTLLRLISTAIRPSYGGIDVDGLDVVRNADLVRERVAFLSHETGLYDDLTARENLAFAAELLGTPDRSARVDRALEDVGLAGRAGERAGALSAGMRRRLALGRILLGRPSLVLLDEPTSALDSEGIDLVERLLAAWRGAGVSVIVASHSVDRLGGSIDARVRLDRGVVAEVAGDAVTWSPVPGVATPRPVVAVR